jgi:hypothetical protein
LHKVQIKHVENGILREENINLPSVVTRELLTEWAHMVLTGIKSPALAHWIGAGKPFSRNDYTEFVHIMIEAGILFISPGKGTQLTDGGEHALRRLLEKITPPLPDEDVCNE